MDTATHINKDPGRWGSHQGLAIPSGVEAEVGNQPQGQEGHEEAWGEEADASQFIFDIHEEGHEDDSDWGRAAGCL